MADELLKVYIMVCIPFIYYTCNCRQFTVNIDIPIPKHDIIYGPGLGVPPYKYCIPPF